MERESTFKATLCDKVANSLTLSLSGWCSLLCSPVVKRIDVQLVKPASLLYSSHWCDLDTVFPNSLSNFWSWNHTSDQPGNNLIPSQCVVRSTTQFSCSQPHSWMTICGFLVVLSVYRKLWLNYSYDEDLLKKYRESWGCGHSFGFKWNEWGEQGNRPVWWTGPRGGVGHLSLHKESSARCCITTQK